MADTFKTLKVTDETFSPVTIDSGIKVVDASERTTAFELYGNNLDNSISGGGGNGDDLLRGGKGNDTLYGEDGSDVFVYAQGEGNDLIVDFNADDTLNISVGDYSTAVSGADVLVAVGDGEITLAGAASLSAVNIISGEMPTWTLDGTTATYGSLTVTGVTSLDGLKFSGKTLTVSKSSLGTDDVKISDGYTLKLGSDVTKTSTKKAWSLSKTTATYKQTTAAGYTLADNANDNLIVNYGANVSIVSGAGNDSIGSNHSDATIDSGAGEDTLWGSAGSDTLFGGKDKDTFIYYDGKDIISDYTSVDKVMVSGKIETPSVDSEGNVTFQIGTGQLIFPNSSNKYIYLLDDKGNRLMTYKPTGKG